MATIEIPNGVGVVSLAMVGNATRVLLRSDGRFVCVTCGRTPLVVDAEEEAARPRIERRAADSCHHIDAILKLGLVRVQTGEDGRPFPEFVWKRANAGSVQARWPDNGDPDNAIGMLAEALRATVSGARGLSMMLSDETCRAVAAAAIQGMRRKGYVVMPEWMSRGRAAPPTPGTGRGARLIDLDDEETP